MRVFNLSAGREIDDLKRRAVEAVLENECDAILEYLHDSRVKIYFSAKSIDYLRTVGLISS